MDLVLLIIAILVILFFALDFAFIFFAMRPWIRAQSAGVPLKLSEVVRMLLRRNPPGLLVEACSLLRKTNVATPIRDVEALYTAHRSEVQSAEDLVRLVLERRGTGK